jgi:hypothetical protein
MMSRQARQRNDSSGSHGSTDHDTNIPLNLSNLSTTPTFSNVAFSSAQQPSKNVVESARPIAGSTVQQPHEQHTIQSLYPRPMTLSTFSFSRMASSPNNIMLESIQLPSTVDAVVSGSGVVTSNINSYNSQLSPTPSMAAANNVVPGNNVPPLNNRWSNMFRGPNVVSSNAGSGLLEKRR